MQGSLAANVISGGNPDPIYHNGSDGLSRGKHFSAETKLVVRRRRLKYSSFLPWSTVILLITAASSVFYSVRAFSLNHRNRSLSQRRNDWIQRSVQYYSTVMRKNRDYQTKTSTLMDSTNSLPDPQLLVESQPEDKQFVDLATKHYYARHLVKKGKFKSAETLYRKIIAELNSSTTEDDCDHTKLAVSTLLLALHMQRTGDIKATRAVFLNFFRRVAVAKEEGDEDHKCTCSAKVLQAYALFEMKNGHSVKSFEIIKKAIQMDENLKPVLGWKQFRDAATRAQKP
ncbi:hypothetical protein ACHAXS_002441 [Conticribra weissflogii]